MVQPPSKFDSFPSDGIPPFRYALTATALDLGRGEVMQTLVVTPVCGCTIRSNENVPVQELHEACRSQWAKD
jgi:hypothetical protein